MTRKLRRTRDFELTLDIKSDQFIAPPRDSQRNWLLNKAVAEFADDLNQLDVLAQRFVPGLDAHHIEERANTALSDADIMEDWQIPLMRAMACVATQAHGDVLEIGFGRGVSAAFIQEFGARSHTIVECNDSVVERFHAWRAQWPQRDIRLIYGRWQDTTDQMGLYDSVFFHTYPLNETEYAEQVLNSVTFAEHFFPTAVAHLRDGGVFTYMTNEMDSFSRAHQRLVLRYFKSFELSRVALVPPADIRDTWWADSMIVIKATK
jgi:guanidinoacetate N-methyltransferase